FFAGGRAGGAFAEILLVGVACVLVVVAIQAQQLPVGAVLRVVVVIVVAVVHGQLAQALAGELAGTAPTDVRVHFQRLVPVAFFTVALGVGKDAVELAGGGSVGVHVRSRGCLRGSGQCSPAGSRREQQ